MNIAEYYALERVEKEHWFYQGKRELARYWIARAGLTPKAILDAGAGTGHLVGELREAYPLAAVIGVEYEREAREIAAKNGLTLTDGSIMELPLADETMTISIALDVLEHVVGDGKALSELVRVTEQGGLIILNVPAFQSLWSEWDVSLGHHRRYTKRTLQQIIAAHASGCDVLKCDYLNSVTFLPILLYRKIAARLTPKKRMEDSVPPRWLNTLLRSSFVLTARWQWFHPPFGTSLFCVLRKR